CSPAMFIHSSHILSLFLYCSLPLQYLHSFPTRRSSDLVIRPTLSVLMVFFFIWTWNEFYIPVVLLNDQSAQTIPIALATLRGQRSEEHTSELQSRFDLVCRLLLEKKNKHK